ncbi:hypothetical protein [Sphingobium sp.]|uniref:hypothetical protein n=1 Tax=Sphingobium sp. TaxID=1912891 RepID=UPI0028BEC1F9|nr:hypothetical protein [Sphingobium sp.]
MTTARALLKRFWPALAAPALVTLVLLLVRCSDRAQDNAVTQAHDAGVAQQRADTATATLDQTLKAAHAEEAIRRDPVVRNASCLRHSRTPENC